MNKPLVLVVEDDTPVRNLITTTLKTHEYRYLSAQNGASAVMEALSHNPDIVLLDLGLPDMDGVEIIQKIRSWSNMPIIVISARTEDSDKIGALDAGADDYRSTQYHKYIDENANETRHHICFFVVESSSTYRFRMASQHIVRS